MPNWASDCIDLYLSVKDIKVNLNSKSVSVAWHVAQDLKQIQEDVDNV